MYRITAFRLCCSSCKKKCIIKGKILDLQKWLNRRHADLDYYITQFFKGYSGFKQCLHRFGEDNWPLCIERGYVVVWFVFLELNKCSQQTLEYNTFMANGSQSVVAMWSRVVLSEYHMQSFGSIGKRRKWFIRAHFS